MQSGCDVGHHLELLAVADVLGQVEELGLHIIYKQLDAELARGRGAVDILCGGGQAQREQQTLVVGGQAQVADGLQLASAGGQGLGRDVEPVEARGRIAQTGGLH